MRGPAWGRPLRHLRCWCLPGCSNFQLEGRLDDVYQQGRDIEVDRRRDAQLFLQLAEVIFRRMRRMRITAVLVTGDLVVVGTGMRVGMRVVGRRVAVVVTMTVPVLGGHAGLRNPAVSVFLQCQVPPDEQWPNHQADADEDSEELLHCAGLAVRHRG